MLKYIQGNLLDAPQSIIVHSCNAKGVMGAGVAKAIRNKYPVAYDYYKMLISSKSSLNSANLLGMIQLVHVTEDKIICNLIGQDNWSYTGDRLTSYDALVVGFTKLKYETQGIDIAMPYIGCGLGGGDWKIVSAIIESVFDDRDVFVYYL